jgi:hypothetical protein
MRHALALLAVLLLCPAARASADCAAGSVGVWPSPERPLAPSGLVVVDGYGTDRSWVREIARYRPRLEGAGEAVPLEVVETNEGEFEVTQVVLRARRPLRAGSRYRLVLTGRSNPRLWGSRGRVPLVWTVASPDSTPPRWTEAPRMERTSFTAFGCGPAIYAHVRVRVSDASDVLYRVTVEPVSGGAARTYLIEARDGELQVGHGMCSGPFVLAAGIRYRIRVTAVDAAGNETPAPGTPLEAEGPQSAY